MNTPICDFVRRYASENPLRLHMPGHKGVPVLGMEHLDLTEIDGADSLYEADGIIRESEENAGRHFGCRTYYSTEGSSQCIRAMLYLARLYGKRHGAAPLVAAARNVHKTFLSAAALLDLSVDWLYPEEDSSYLACRITPQTLETYLHSADPRPMAVYLTSPDYLGNVADIAGLSGVCRRYGVLLLVDNAHGAYLRFLLPSRHPMDLGADLSCDSAHKTLPVLTGGAYLHLAASVEAELAPHAKNALQLFGSTSPSYLILQSLDAANRYLETYPEKLAQTARRLDALTEELRGAGYTLAGQEALKLTISAKPYGYTGTELAEILRTHRMECEFADPDFLVLMFTPEIGTDEMARVSDVLRRIPQKNPLTAPPPVSIPGERVCSIREAMLAWSETVPAAASVGRILAAPSVACPPAVPILVCGERITAAAVERFAYYGIRELTVIAE